VEPTWINAKKDVVNLEDDSRRSSIYPRHDRGLIDDERFEGKGEILCCPDRFHVDFVADGISKVDERP